MNTAEAISHLKHIGFTVTEKNGKYDVHRRGYKYPSDMENYELHLMSAREMIKFANAFSSANKQNTALKSKVKKIEKGRNRAHTRTMLNSKDDEKIEDTFSTNKKAVSEDIWYHD